MTQRRFLFPIIIILSLFGVFTIGQKFHSFAQVIMEQRPKPAPKPPRAPRPPVARGDAEDESSEPLQASMKLDRGGKVTISNRFGIINVKGYDGDTVEAKATNTSGEDVSSKTPLIKGDATRMRISFDGVAGRRHGREFQIKVPRYAVIEIIDCQETEVDVQDIDGSVIFTNGSGSARINRIGSLSLDWQRGDVAVNGVKGRCLVKVFNGEINIENVAGSVEASSISGELRIINAGENVKAYATSGEIYIQCVQGRVNADAVSGSIELMGIKGNVECETVSGEITFKGPIRADGIYRMKSMNGEVTMHIQNDAPGFTVTLMTFNGEIETAFPIKVDSAVQQNEINRRIIGRYGNGQAKISLDSFNAGVRIVKATAADLKNCK
jgi:phage baseplate assembly protein gpV